MNFRNIAYWGTTGLAAAGLTAGGMGPLTRAPRWSQASTPRLPGCVATLLGA
jgi:hypothetical protein